MKYVIPVVLLAAIIGVGVWLHNTPKDAVPFEQTVKPAELESTPSDTPSTAQTPEAPKKSIKTITTKDNMKIEITKEGTGVAITNGQTAVVDYVGKLEDGTVFDASQKHGQTFSFTLGAGQVIKGWDEGVLGMKVGEMRTLTIPSDLAYGANGIPGAIPGGATLIFDVTLQGIK